jgi:hypothetical protein
MRKVKLGIPCDKKSQARCMHVVVSLHEKAWDLSL